MSNCGEKNKYCRSIFQDGSSETTVERFTAVWAKLINLLENHQTDEQANCTVETFYETNSLFQSKR